MPELTDLVIPHSFDQLKGTDVERSLTLLSALWSSGDPRLDVRTGALRSLVTLPAASLFEAAKYAFRSGSQYSNLALLADHSSKVDAAILDKLAANYKVVRKNGTSAFGKIRLVFSQPVSMVIGLTDTFEANGMIFTPVRTYAAADLPKAANAPSLEYLTFLPMPDDSGYMFYDIEVRAAAEGLLGNLAKGAAVTLSGRKLSYFVRAFVVESFSGGSDGESNADIIQRMIHGISAKVLSSRTNMQASLLEVFPNVRDSSIIGAGDDEMTRDKHSVFPGAAGGYADWYIAATRQLQTATYTFEHFQELKPGEYQITLLEEHFPCLYWVLEVLDEATNKSCTLTEQTKYAVPGDEDAPRIYEDEESMFTVYQATDVRFEGPEGLQAVKISGMFMPQIKEIQNWVLRCGQAPLGLDVLVKGAVPVTVQFSAVLNTPMGLEVDFTSLQGKVADYVNRIPFDGILSLSGLISLVHSSLPEGSYVSDPALFAAQWLSAVPVSAFVRDRLVLNQLPFGTNRTSILYCDPAKVSFQHKFIESRCS
jgi:hypothetical protein